MDDPVAGQQVDDRTVVGADRPGHVQQTTAADMRQHLGREQQYAGRAAGDQVRGETCAAPRRRRYQYATRPATRPATSESMCDTSEFALTTLAQAAAAVP